MKAKLIDTDGTCHEISDPRIIEMARKLVRWQGALTDIVGFLFEHDGRVYHVVEPRVLSMMRALCTRQGKVAGISNGQVRMDFSGPKRGIHIQLAESERVR